jgi:hypothetical protein
VGSVRGLRASTGTTVQKGVERHERGDEDSEGDQVCTSHRRQSMQIIPLRNGFWICWGASVSSYGKRGA